MEGLMYEDECRKMELRGRERKDDLDTRIWKGR